LGSLTVSWAHVLLHNKNYFSALIIKVQENLFFLSLFVVRICETGEELPPSSFVKDPDFHVFPLANLHSNRVLRVSVQSLPRCDIFNFTDEILASKINLLSAGHKQEQKEHKNVKENTISNDELLRSPLKKKSCMKDLEANHHLQTLNENNLTNKEKNLDFSKPSTSRTLAEQVSRNCDENLLISPKISQDSLKASYLKLRSLSEGTNDAKLHGQTNQNNCSKIHQPVHNLETKQVSKVLCITVFHLQSSNNCSTKKETLCRDS